MFITLPICECLVENILGQLFDNLLDESILDVGKIILRVVVLESRERLFPILLRILGVTAANLDTDSETSLSGDSVGLHSHRASVVLDNLTREVNIAILVNQTETTLVLDTILETLGKRRREVRVDKRGSVVDILNRESRKILRNRGTTHREADSARRQKEQSY